MVNMESSNKAKQCVKEARKSLQEKDYHAALEHCEWALKLDPQNYNALVFKALALQETRQIKQAVESFERAISFEPEQILAWKGLCGYYEKNPSPENDQKLIEVYKSLEALFRSDGVKHAEIISKLILLAKNVGDTKECIRAMGVLADTHYDSKDERGEFCAWNSLISYTLSLNEFEDYYDILEKAFERSLITSKEARIPQFDLNILRNNYLLFLKSQGSIPQVVEQAKSYLLESENDPQWLEFICRYFMECCLTESDINQVFDPSEIKEMVLLLLGIETEKGKELVVLNNMVHGAILYQECNAAKALPLVSEALSGNSQCIEGWVLMSSIHLSLHNYEESEKSCVSGLTTFSKLKPPDSYSSTLNSLYATMLCINLSKALIQLNRLENAKQAQLKAQKRFASLTNFKRKEKIENELLVCESLIAIACNDWQRAREILQRLEETMPHYANLIRAKILLNDKDYAEAEKFINLSLEQKETPEGLHELSVIQWEHGLNRSEAVKNILKACKADPYYGRNYLYLGHFYKLQTNLSRARQCYYKAYNLDPYNEKCALYLSDFVAETEKTDATEQINVLKAISKKHSRLPWVWFRLGLCYMNLGETMLTVAVQALQNAIRIEPNDSKSWECLGDAYLLQGSYGASLKAFNKLVLLKPDDIYSSYQVAKNKQLLELHSEALQEFRDILKKDANYIPACLGFVECQYSLAKDYLLESCYGLAKDCAIEALVFLNSNILDNKKGDFVCFYKLAGDLTTLLADLGTNHLPMELPCQLYGLPKKDTTYSLLDLLTSANSCYGKGVSLKPELDTIWHDLGVTYYRLYHCQRQNSFAKRIAEKSQACLKQALELNQTEASHWLALGVISALVNYADGSGFAQNCFVRTLQLDPKSVTAWSNLGVLYLNHENYKLANDAFSRGQSVAPTNEVPWIGQAVIAEALNDYETFDLFRHSTILKPNLEGVLGYGHWLISQLVHTDTKTEEMVTINMEYTRKWVTQAVDCLTKLTESENTNAEAYHYLALVLERQTLYQPAVRACRRSYKLLRDGGAPIEQVEASKANLGRLLRLAGFKEESLAVLNEIKNPDVSIYCETALSFLETGSPEKAFQAYEMALNASATTSPNLQSHILTAMAFVIRKVPGYEEQTKTLLFKAVTCQPQSVPGLLALCALGFLNSDSELIDAALSELELYKFDQQYWPQIAHLFALNKVVRGDLKGGIRQLTKAIHWQPHSSELWSHLATFLLLSVTQDAKKATICAKNAWIHASQNENSLAQKLTMVNCYLASNNVKSSRSVALKAVHCQPDNLKAWCCLLAAKTSSSTKRINLEPIFKGIRKISETSDKVPVLLQDWVDAMETYNSLHEGLTKRNGAQSQVLENGQSFIANQIEQALSKKETSKLVDFLKNALGNDLPQVSSSIIWMTLVKNMINSAQYTEATKEIHLWLQSLEEQQSSSEEKLVPLLYLSLLANEASHVEKQRADHWLGLGKEALAQVVKLAEDCKVAHFLLGLLSLTDNGSKDQKMAKSCLENSLFKGEASEVLLNFEPVARRLLTNLYSSNTSKSSLEKLLVNAQTSGDTEIEVALTKMLKEKSEK